MQKLITVVNNAIKKIMIWRGKHAKEVKSSLSNILYSEVDASYLYVHLLSCRRKTGKSGYCHPAIKIKTVSKLLIGHFFVVHLCATKDGRFQKRVRLRYASR